MAASTTWPCPEDLASMMALSMAQGIGVEAGSQSMGEVCRILVDALHGGDADIGIDALLDGLAAHGGGLDGIAFFAGSASLFHDNVSAWHMGQFGGFTPGANDFTMETLVLHHDAVQPVANG